jgi:dephospho-CoA kinase
VQISQGPMISTQRSSPSSSASLLTKIFVALCCLKLVAVLQLFFLPVSFAFFAVPSTFTLSAITTRTTSNSNIVQPYFPSTTQTSSRFSSLTPTRMTKAAATSAPLLSERLSDDRLQVRVLGVCGGIGSGKSTACKWLATISSSSSSSSKESATMTINSIIHHLDADSLAHAVYAPGSQVIKEIVGVFGDDVLVVPTDVDKDDEGGANAATPPLPTIDRKKLGAIVFSDPSEMSKLERLVWPHVKTLIVERIEEIAKDTAETIYAATGTSTNDPQKLIIVLEGAVLLDAGWDDDLDGVWVVTAPKPVTLSRLIETRGLSQEEAEKRIDAQQSRRGMGLASIQNDVDSGAITGVIDNSGSLDDLKEKLITALNDESFWKQKK